MFVDTLMFYFFDFPQEFHLADPGDIYIPVYFIRRSSRALCFVNTLHCCPAKLLSQARRKSPQTLLLVRLASGRNLHSDGAKIFSPFQVLA